MRRWSWIPLFMRDGGVPVGYGDQRAAWVFARSAAEFTLYDDDGLSLDYQRGGYTALRISVEAEVQPKAERTHTGYDLPYREIMLRVSESATPDDRYVAVI